MRWCTLLLRNAYTHTLNVWLKDMPQHLIHVYLCREYTPYANCTCLAVGTNYTPHHYLTPKICVPLTNGSRIIAVAMSSPQHQSRSSASIQKPDSSLKTALFHWQRRVARLRYQTNLSQRWTGVRRGLRRKLRDCKSVLAHLRVTVCVDTGTSSSHVSSVGCRLLKITGLLQRYVGYCG